MFENKTSSHKNLLLYKKICQESESNWRFEIGSLECYHYTIKADVTSNIPC